MLLSLPNELLLDIAESLTDINDVHSLLLTSKHLSNLLQPLLDKESTKIQAQAVAKELPLIHFAAFENNQIIAKLAIKLDPLCINRAYRQHRTALHIAADKGFVEMVQLLLKHRASPNAVGGVEALPIPPLSVVLENLQWHDFETVPLRDQFLEIAFHLLNAGANPSLPGRNRENALIQASRMHMPKLLTAILDTGMVDINSTGSQRASALHNAVLFAGPGIDPVATLLIERGINVNARDVLGRTALYESCAAWGNSNTTDLLVKYGTDINSQDEFGMTVLHHIAIFSHEAHSVVALKQLLRSEIPIQYGLRDIRMKTANDYAVEGGNERLSAMLKDK